jgi:hypothetical protein
MGYIYTLNKVLLDIDIPGISVGYQREGTDFMTLSFDGSSMQTIKTLQDSPAGLVERVGIEPTRCNYRDSYFRIFPLFQCMEMYL